MGLRALPVFTAGVASVQFAGSDVGSGVGTFDVRYRRAGLDRRFGSFGYPTSWQGTSARSVALMLSPGSSYCFSVRVRDKAGNLSPWSKEQCTTAPLDDRALAQGPGWVRQQVPSAYGASQLVATRAGSTLTRAHVTARRIALVVTTCPGCGTVGVYWNGVLLRTVNLAGTTQFRKIVVVVDLGALRSGTLSLRTGSAKPAEIDGLGLAG